MRRTLRRLPWVALLLAGVAQARPNDRNNEYNDAQERSRQHLGERYTGTGGADQINAGLRGATQGGWLRQVQTDSVAQLTGPVVKTRARTLYVQGEEGAV